MEDQGFTDNVNEITYQDPPVGYEPASGIEPEHSGIVHTHPTDHSEFEPDNTPMILLIIGAFCLIVAILFNPFFILTITGYGTLLYGYFGFRNHAHTSTKTFSLICGLVVLAHFILLCVVLLLIVLPILLVMPVAMVIVIVLICVFCCAACASSSHSSSTS